MRGNKGPYKEEFPKGSRLKIADRRLLERFVRTWKFHRKLRHEQLKLGTKAESVRFYDGGDELYELKGVPGVWHEQCLRAVERKVSSTDSSNKSQS